MKTPKPAPADSAGGDDTAMIDEALEQGAGSGADGGAATQEGPGDQDGAPPPLPTTKPYLSAAASEAFGPAGHFHDLTEEELAEAPKGLFVEPTADQLALRVR